MDTHDTKISLYVLFGLFLAGIVTWLVLDWVRLPETSIDDVRDTAKKVLSGDFVTARESAINLGSVAEHPETQAAAHNVAGFAASMTSKEGRLESVRLAKADFLAPVSAATKATAINRVIEAMMVSRDEDIINEVFSGQAFSQYRVPDDFVSSVVSLARFSESLYPTSVATWYTALANSAPLTNFGKKYTLTKEQKISHAEGLLMTIHRAEDLYEAERSVRQGSSLVEFDPARQLYLQGLYYGIVARVKPEYLDEAETAHRALVSYHEETRDAEGRPLVPVETRLPYNYVDHATLLLLVGGEGRHEDIRDLLRKMIALVKANPQLHEHGYVSRLKSIIQKPDTGVYKNYVRLAGIEPEFKAFLEGYGAKFE